MAIGRQHSQGLWQFSSVYVVLYTDETKELEFQRHSWSACYVVLLYKMKKKKHCGHQYIKVIHKVTIYLGPNLILRSLNVPSPKFECGWKVGEIGYYLTKLGISSQHLHHLSWWQDLISKWRVQATEQWRHSYGKFCLRKILCIPSNMLQKIWEDVMYWYWPLSFTKLDVAASLAQKRLEIVELPIGSVSFASKLSD